MQLLLQRRIRSKPLRQGSRSFTRLADGHIQLTESQSIKVGRTHRSAHLFLSTWSAVQVPVCLGMALNRQQLGIGMPRCQPGYFLAKDRLKNVSYLDQAIGIVKEVRDVI